MYCYHPVIIKYDQKYKKLIISKTKFHLISKKKKEKRFIMYYRPCIGNKSFPSASNLYVTGILLPVEYGYQSHIFEIHSISNEKPWIMIK